MLKLMFFVVLVYLTVVLAEPRESQRGVIHQIQKGVAGPNPYIFLTVPKSRSQTLLQGFEVIEENDKAVIDKENGEDQEADYDDEDMIDDDDDDEVEQQSLDNTVSDDEDDEGTKDTLDQNVNKSNEPDMDSNLKLQKSKDQITNDKLNQMIVSNEHAGAILVPDEIIEIEGQSVIDEKTGKPALLLPRAILDSIPDGSIVAIMARSTEDAAEERANRVIVRRRRKNARVNIKRRRGTNNLRRVIKCNCNQRRGNNRRRNVRRGSNRRSSNRRGNTRRRIYSQA